MIAKNKPILNIETKSNYYIIKSSRAIDGLSDLGKVVSGSVKVLRNLSNIKSLINLLFTIHYLPPFGSEVAFIHPTKQLLIIGTITDIESLSAFIVTAYSKKFRINPDKTICLSVMLGVKDLIKTVYSEPLKERLITNYIVTPYDRQMEAARLFLTRGNLILSWDLGVGKTYGAIVAVLNFIQQRDFHSCIIICPKPVIDVWKIELAKSCIDSISIRDYKRDDRLEALLKSGLKLLNFEMIPHLIELITQSMSNERNTIINNEIGTNHKVLLERINLGLLQDSDTTNNFSMSADNRYRAQCERSKIFKIKKRADETIKHVVIKKYFTNTIAIVDEVQRVRNTSTKTHQLTKLITDECSFRIGLSGGLIMNGEPDIWGPMRVISPDSFGTSHSAFMDKYFTINSDGKYVPKPSKKEEFINTINNVLHVVKKADCMDLPEQVFKQQFYEMTTLQKRIYKSAESDLFVELLNTKVNTDNFFSKLQKTLQILSGFVYSEGKAERFVDSEKFSVVREILENNVIEKVVLWYCYKATQAVLIDMVNKLGLTYTTNWIEFQNNDSIQIIITTPAQAGVGINLNKAKFVIFSEINYFVESFFQALGRTHRIGMDKMLESMTYFFPQCQDTIETKCFEVLMEKRDGSSNFIDRLKKALLGDDIK